MKIYVDNNILSSIAGLLISDENGLALQKLAESKHCFQTSKITKDEMLKSSNQKVKGAILFIYKIFGGKKFFNKETYLATGFGDATFGSVPWGGGEAESPVLSILRQAFEPDDARHIYQALTDHFDYFLTLDENTILKRYRTNYKNIKAFCSNGHLKLVNPEELVVELGL